MSEKQSLFTELTAYKEKLLGALQNVDESSLEVLLCKSDIAVLENQVAATDERLSQCRGYTASARRVHVQVIYFLEGKRYNALQRQEHTRESLKLLSSFRELSILDVGANNYQTTNVPLQPTTAG